MKFNNNNIEKLQRKLNDVKNISNSIDAIASEKDRVNQRISMYHKNNEKIGNKLKNQNDVQKHSYYNGVNKNNK